MHLIGLPNFGVGDTKTCQESPDVFFVFGVVFSGHQGLFWGWGVCESVWFWVGFFGTSGFGFGLVFFGRHGLASGFGVVGRHGLVLGLEVFGRLSFPAHLIIRACAHGEKYSCLARLGGALYMYYASVSSLHRESTYSLVYTLNGVLLFGERERANLVVRLARFFYIYVYICLYICIVGRVHIVRMRILRETPTRHLYPFAHCCCI